MTELVRRPVGRTALEVTSLGLGTSPLGGCGVTANFADFEQTVLQAFQSGVRYFDTAPLYGLGKAEHSLGHILRVAGIRDQVVISTKVGRKLKPASRGVRAPSTYAINWIDPLPYVDEYDYSYDGIMRAFEDSQQRMGIDQIDILYVHDIGIAWFGDEYPRFLTQMRDGGFRALDQLRSEGSVRAVGLGVNETKAVLDIAAEFALDCSMVAGRYSLLNHEPLEAFFPECERRGISIIAAGVYNSGILAQGTRGLAEQATYDCQPPQAKIVERVRALEAICERFATPLGAAALQFVYANPSVASVVVGALTPAQIAQSVSSLSTRIPAGLWAEMKSQSLIPSTAPVPN